MKKNTILISFLTLIVFACSDFEPESEVEVNQDESMMLLAKDIIQSDYFKSAANKTASETSRAKSSSENTFRIVQTSVFNFYILSYDAGFLIVSTLKSNADLKMHPNGTASFSLDLDGPWCLWTDSLQGEYNNSCYQHHVGQFSLDYNGKVDVVEQPWGSVYTFNAPHKTPLIAKARNFVLNDAETYDPNIGSSYCRDDSILEKTINMTFVKKWNNKKETSENLFSLNVK
ncbi:hypothetical protein NA63_1881 [Flavobacteriaceae bacterium MAR_2010_105]|nr:hypothetical protein NA63_1881 [Flavobacteriaceae bacterium MAR_2010_105]